MLESFNSDKFEYKRLTEDEQQKRGILGRLKGIIADTKNSTRNGRKYSSKLWENVFNNDVMKEKIANRCVFGELGHPTDREETDMEKIAICLAEQPKMGSDGKIYGVFDILNTPNGKILKSLCDYGCTIGVSSRGTGDLYTDDDGNEAVDPDTYNCECWDAVLVPAVKEARMQYVSESLEKKKRNKTLRQALQESLDKANIDDKKIMTESLDTLGIKLNEDIEPDTDDPELFIDIANINNNDVNGTFATTVILNGQPEEVISDLNFQYSLSKEDYGDEYNIDDIEFSNIKLQSGKEFDEQEVEDYLYNIFDTRQEEFYKEAQEAMNGYKAEHIKDERLISTLRDSQEVNEECNNESCSDKDAEEVVNDKSGELVAELQEALLKIKSLEDDNLSLQEKLSVCNAKENGLQEQLGKYREAVAKLSVEAKKNKSLNSDKSKLTEDLNKQTELSSLNKARVTSLINAKKDLITQLNESKAQYKEAQAQIEELNGKLSKLNESLDAQSKQLDSTKETLNKYRKSYNALKENYIDIKADNYGINKSQIKSKLKESYTIKDVDSICEELYKNKSKLSKLPFVINENTNIEFKKSSNESIINESLSNNSDDYISDSLLQLANLK